MDSLPASNWTSVPPNGCSSILHRDWENVERTDRIKNEDLDEGDSEEDSDDEEDEFKNAADKIMLINGASSSKTYSTNHSGSNGYADYDNVALPPNLKWPHHILIVNRNSGKHSVMKQFIKPQTYATRLLRLNEDLNLTASQLKAAYAYAVNNVKDQVDLTQLAIANPGLNAEGFQAETERQIQEVIAQVETKNVRSGKEQLADIRHSIQSHRGSKGKLDKLLRKERLLAVPQAVQMAQRKTKKALKKARRLAKYGKRPKHKHARTNDRGAVVEPNNKRRGI